MQIKEILNKGKWGSKDFFQEIYVAPVLDDWALKQHIIYVEHINTLFSENINKEVKVRIFYSQVAP